jgi:hypothetical protein
MAHLVLHDAAEHLSKHRARCCILSHLSQACPDGDEVRLCRLPDMTARSHVPPLLPCLRPPSKACDGLRCKNTQALCST